MLPLFLSLYLFSLSTTIEKTLQETITATTKPLPERPLITVKFRSKLQTDLHCHFCVPPPFLTSNQAIPSLEISSPLNSPLPPPTTKSTRKRKGGTTTTSPNHRSAPKIPAHCPDPRSSTPSPSHTHVVSSQAHSFPQQPLCRTISNITTLSP